MNEEEFIGIVLETRGLKQLKTSFKLKPKDIEARRYLSELNEQQLISLILTVDRYRADKNIFLKMLQKMFNLLARALGTRVEFSGCSINDHENAFIEEKVVLYLSKINPRKLGELVAVELVKKAEARLEAEDKTSPE